MSRQVSFSRTSLSNIEWKSSLRALRPAMVGFQLLHAVAEGEAISLHNKDGKVEIAAPITAKRYSVRVGYGGDGFAMTHLEIIDFIKDGIVQDTSLNGAL